MYKNILIPTDGSELSARAIKAGVKLANVTGGSVIGIFVAPTPTPIIYKGLLPVGYKSPDEHAALIAKAAQKNLGVIEKEAKALGVPFRGITVTSDFPADSILQAASDHKCDLIFMASHGHRGVSAILIGSETQKVLSHARIPVLVYRDRYSDVPSRSPS
ncbi:universal stress protein [Propionivibrio soli]|uniref:universal stress protein n=1 Tax=Propionivibrio soli TaxID=2976531 RepID=UPI0021E71195|nr:universal stress protein [Propionivibrio soli]